MLELVSALFDTRTRCDQAVELLLQEGFTVDDVKLVEGVPAGPIEEGDGAPTLLPHDPAPDAPDQVVTWATAGAASGTAMAVLVAGVGAAVPLAAVAVAALAGGTLGGVAGTAFGAAFDPGVPGATPPDPRLRDGGFIVSVRASGERRSNALDALVRAGGEAFDVSG